jgi:GNAT superfamily N-acetyltransferase
MAVWNACFTGRGAVRVPSPTLLEYFTFAKPYFDPQGLVVAEADGQPVGFVHAGFGCNESGTALNLKQGVVCALGVLPDRRRQGVGSELLRRGEAYLRGRGAEEIHAGPVHPLNPFTFGLYGGSQSPGFLDSDSLARSFLAKRGYEPVTTSLVFQRSLAQPLEVADARFANLRQHHDIFACLVQNRNWWQECILGPVELVEYRLKPKGGRHEIFAWARMWEMDTFSHTWGEHAVGLVDLEVLEERRRQGLGKFLLVQLMLHLREQFFSLVEAQTSPENTPTIALLRSLAFQQVDAGHSFLKKNG